MKALIKNLTKEFLPKPTTQNFAEIAKGFLEHWNFPNCCGAVDGKHVRLKAPANSGSLYYNYKNFFSSVLLAVVDSNYKFIAVDIGVPGSQSDSGILESSSMGDMFGANGILPKPSIVHGFSKELPHVIIGDEGFGLKPWLMRPFSKRTLDPRSMIFNYRLSRARRVVENAFGILNSKWRIFNTPIDAKPDLVNLIIMCCVVLHNFLIVQQDDSAITDEEDTHSGLVDIGCRGGQNNSNPAKEVRQLFSEYFTSTAGSLPGQACYTLRGYE